MLFYEPLFLFLFLPVTFGLCWLTRQLAWIRLPLLLVASLVFYAWGEPGFVPVVIASALLDYSLAKFIARGAGWAMAVGVVANLAILVVYKYSYFLVANVLSVAAPAEVTYVPRIALPIGVSFVVFEKITYLVDVARRRSPPASSFAQYLTYVLFFPKLLAGPIIKYYEIEAQFRRHPAPRETMVLDGFRRFMLGVIKKVMLADVLGTAADATFDLPPIGVGFADAWWGVILFTLQIYLDFSAYSDMAIGLASMFGFRLRENFDMPYISCSITEFWRRWHISLSTWIRDYLYIPLGGNRVAPWRVYLNLWLCFLASGLWHGAAWTFLLWGAYNGLFLMLDRLFLLRLLDRMPRVLANAITLVIIMVGWVVFRAGSMAQLRAFLVAMMHPALRGGTVGWNPDTVVALVAGLAIALGPRLPKISRAVAGSMATARSRFAWETVTLLLFAVSLCKAAADPFKPFLYFRF